MAIKLPRIEGTAYDATLNEFIDSVNREVNAEQPKLAVHCAAAIGRFLVENHEVEVGTLWIGKAMPLVGHIPIISPMVDNLYQALVERANQPNKTGCAGVGLILIAIPVVAGFSWWLFAR